LTCIVAISTKQKDGSMKMIMASDSGLFFEDENDEIVEYHISTKPKIFKRSLNSGNNEILIGCAGNSKDCDAIELLDFSKIKMTKKHQKNPGLFLREKFIPYINEKMIEIKYTIEEMDMILALCGEIFYIDAAMTVIDCPSYGFSIGSASLPARAALMTVEKINKDKRIKPISIVKLALQISESCSVTCKSPFHYLEL
jgi:hypothetical protein